MTIAWTPDRAAAFFAARRQRFGPIEHKQVGPLERLAFRMLEDPAWTSLDHVAYALATCHHETARTYLPIAEYASGWDYDPTRNPRKARALGNVEPGDGPRYKGRGFVQLTGRRNMERATRRLRELGIEIDLVAEPDRAMEWEPAYLILREGMYGHGLTFTGHKLSDYDWPEGFAWRLARRIVNGLDRADAIADYGRKYRAVLAAVPG